MKHIKKLSAMLLVALMIFTLTACSNKPSGSISAAESESQDIKGTIKISTETETIQETETTPETEIVPETETAPETEIVQENETTQDADAAQDKLELGTIVGGVYENAYFGIGCSLDENWVYADEDELAEMTGYSSELFNDEELSQQILEADMFFDMFAAADDGAVNMSVNVENLGVLYGMALDEDSYIDMSLESLEDTMASANVTIVDLEKTTVTFADEERPAIRMHSLYEDYDTNVYQLLVCVKQGSYMAAVTITSIEYDVTDSMAAMFYAVE